MKRNAFKKIQGAERRGEERREEGSQGDRKGRRRGRGEKKGRKGRELGGGRVKQKGRKGGRKEGTSRDNHIEKPTFLDENADAEPAAVATERLRLDQVSDSVLDRTRSSLLTSLSMGGPRDLGCENSISFLFRLCVYPPWPRYLSLAHQKATINWPSERSASIASRDFCPPCLHFLNGKVGCIKSSSLSCWLPSDFW